VIFFLLVGVVAAFWPAKITTELKPEPVGAWTKMRPWAALIFCGLAVIAQAPESFNPFIYFQF
jgi:hypothetical protein